MSESFRLEFQFKGAKKRPYHANSTIVQLPPDFQADDDDSEQATKKIKPALVIPLPIPKVSTSGPTNNIEKDLPTLNCGPKSVDEIAALEILNELSSSNDPINASNLIIEIKQSKETRLPILRANLAPELEGIVDEKERFKVDIALRPDEIDLKSNAYKVVPIEEFGAAILRGMGWEGPSKDDEEYSKGLSDPLFAREVHLGLGAKAKPKLDNERHRDKIKHDKLNNEWIKRADNKLLSQSLKEGSIVWLREAQYAGQRGAVKSIRGVPGLNKISVVLEHSGREVVTSRMAAVLLSEEELADKPYMHVASTTVPELPTETNTTVTHISNAVTLVECSSSNATKSSGNASANSPAPYESTSQAYSVVIPRTNTTAGSGVSVPATALSASEGAITNGTYSRKLACSIRQSSDYNYASSPSGDLNKQSTSSSYMDKYRPLQPSSSSTLVTNFNDNPVGLSKTNSGSSKNNLEPRNKGSWLYPGLFVKVVSKKINPSIFLRRGVILDVYGDNAASIRLEHNREVYDGVKQKYLETVIPQVKENCIILSGKYRNIEAILIEKFVDREKVVVQLAEDLSVVCELGYDDVCAFQSDIYYQH